MLTRLIVFVLLSWHGAYAAATCPPIPDALDDLLDAGNVVLFGEIHGTQEMPQHFASAVCHARAKDVAVRIGLELPDGAPSGVTRWMASAGHLDDQMQLRQSPFWLSDYQDGRASQAMYALLGELRASRDDLTVFTFDRQVANRDHVMAQRILEKTSDDALTLVLTGNIHSRTGVGAPWDPDFVTMGSVIRSQHANTFGVHLRHTGGSAWVCAPQCGERELKGGAMPDDGVFGAAKPPHDWQWWVGAIQASPPMQRN